MWTRIVSSIQDVIMGLQGIIKNDTLEFLPKNPFDLLDILLISLHYHFTDF